MNQLFIVFMWWFLAQRGFYDWLCIKNALLKFERANSKEIYFFFYEKKKDD